MRNDNTTELLADHTYLSEIEYVSLNADGQYSQLQDIFFIHDVFLSIFVFNYTLESL